MLFRSEIKVNPKSQYHISDINIRGFVERESDESLFSEHWSAIFFDREAFASKITAGSKRLSVICRG